MNDAAPSALPAGPARYHLAAQFLHWAMAAILIYLIAFSNFEEASDAEMTERIKLHASLGVAIVVLTLARLALRKTKPRPAPIANVARWEAVATSAAHRLFYALFLIAPAIGFILAGLVAYPVALFGLFDIAGWLADNEGAADIVNSFHGLSADIMLVLIVIHVAAALRHQFLKRDGVIWRMLPFGGPAMGGSERQR